MTEFQLVQRAVEAYFAGMVALDGPQVGRAFAEDARLYSPPGGEPVVGRADIERRLGRMLEAAERLSVSPVATFVYGTGAAVYHHGDLTSKRGVSVPFEGIDTFEIDDAGQICEVRFYWDPVPFLTALFGAAGPPQQG